MLIHLATVKPFAYVMVASFFITGCQPDNKNSENKKKEDTETLTSLEFSYQEITGIGFENGWTRRDPSDVIKVNDYYYVWYTKVKGRSPGYWGTIYYAISEDGLHWMEKGEALGAGKPGEFDSHAVFTPNILQYRGSYYLYYTAVKPTPENALAEFENNSVNDFTYIGVAVSSSPDGPFVRCSGNPIISPSIEKSAFDSYRVDDAALVIRNGEIWLYYKGRNITDGFEGPSKTKMGVAFAENPEGPYKKFGKPILENSHEVLIWRENTGIAALASKSKTLEYAIDGLDFNKDGLNLKLCDIPNAPGAFRPDLVDPQSPIYGIKWGISMIHNGDECYLIRYDCINRIRIVSYNIWNGFDWGKDSTKRNYFIQWTQSYQPDIIGLQELCTFTEDKLQLLAEECGYKYSVIAKEEGYPVGLISRYPITLIKKRIEGMHHGYIHCRVRDIDIWVIHFSPSSYRKRNEEALIISEDITGLLPNGSKVIIMGDFNADSPLDKEIIDKKPLLLERYRAGDKDKPELKKNLRDNYFDFQTMETILTAGLIDSYVQVNSLSERAWSFPTEALVGAVESSERGHRIDYIMVSEFLAGKIINSVILHDSLSNQISDHYPVISDFVW